MSSISTYEELVEERKKVEANIATSKLILQQGVRDLQEKLTPILNLLPLLNVFNRKKNGSPFLNFMASLGIDLFVGQRMLSKSGWLSRLFIPLVLKGATALALGKSKAPARIVPAEEAV